MIAAVVLAAGASRRMRGRAKPLLRFSGRPLIRIVVDAAIDAGCRPVIVVVGAHAEPIRAELSGTPAKIVDHPGWRNGMGSSIRAGIRQLPSGEDGPRGALLLTCDQPRVSPDLINELVAAFDAAPGRRVACEYSGTVGVPALFERSLFPALMARRGDRGAKSLLLRDPSRLIRVDWPQGSENVNTPEDYRALAECEPEGSAL